LGEFNDWVDFKSANRSFLRRNNIGKKRYTARVEQIIPPMLHMAKAYQKISWLSNRIKGSSPRMVDKAVSTIGMILLLKALIKTFIAVRFGYLKR
jgi:hypothetical protein